MKNNGLDTEESSIHQFLREYWILPNPNTISGKSPTELMFSRKIRSVFDRLLPIWKKKIIYSNNKDFKNTIYSKVFQARRQGVFLMYYGTKEFLEDGVISFKNWRNDVYVKG